MMGTLITEGQHIFIERKDPNWRPAFIYLLDNVWKEQEIQKVPSLYLRDFPADDVELQEFLTDQGFVRIKMPNTHIIHDLSFNNVMDYLTIVGVKRRGHIKKDVLNLIDYFDVEIKNNNLLTNLLSNLIVPKRFL